MFQPKIVCPKTEYHVQIDIYNDFYNKKRRQETPIKMFKNCKNVSDPFANICTKLHL